MHAHRHVLSEKVSKAGCDTFLSNSQQAAIKHGRTRPKRPRRTDEDNNPDAPLAADDKSPDAPVAAVQDPWLALGSPMYVGTAFRKAIFKYRPCCMALGTYHCGVGAVGSPTYLTLVR